MAPPILFERGYISISIEVPTPSTTTPARSPTDPGPSPDSSGALAIGDLGETELDGEPWDGDWDGEEWCGNETWEGEEWDPSWGDELEDWDPSWGNQVWDGESWVEPCRLDFGSAPTVPDTNETNETNETGLVETPAVSSVVVTSMPPPEVPCTKGQPPKPVESDKITYKPMSKEGFSEFSERAWPKSGEPSGSGLVRSPTNIGGPSSSEIETERMVYPEYRASKTWLGASYTMKMGDKPQGNENPLDVQTLEGMTLKEHIIHVKWYDSLSGFKAKIPDGVSQQLWGELVEIFKMWHVYNIEDPETVLFYLRKKWSLEYYG